MFRSAARVDTIGVMMRRRSTLLAIAGVMALVGCAKSRSYQVAVRNDTSDPITVGFAKVDGGPFEPQWATPEELAIATPDPNAPGQTWDSVVVPPGKTGVAGPIKGKFDSAAKAMLRIYGSNGPIHELLAISPGSPRRVDVPLAPGRNALIVRVEGGKLAVERVAVPSGKS